MQRARNRVIDGKSVAIELQAALEAAKDVKC
jgi:hypothetical protein